MALTDISLKALKAPEKGQVMIWDDPPGFGVRSNGGRNDHVVFGVSHDADLRQVVGDRGEGRDVLAEFHNR